jgi:hypothetical protein
MKNGRTSGFTVLFLFFVVTSQFFIQFLFSRYLRGGKANDGIHCVCCLYPPIIDNGQGLQGHHQQSPPRKFYQPRYATAKKQPYAGIHIMQK